MINKNFSRIRRLAIRSHDNDSAKILKLFNDGHTIMRCAILAFVNQQHAYMVISKHYNIHKFYGKTFNKLDDIIAIYRRMDSTDSKINIPSISEECGLSPKTVTTVINVMTKLVISHKGSKIVKMTGEFTEFPKRRRLTSDEKDKIAKMYISLYPKHGLDAVRLISNRTNIKPRTIRYHIVNTYPSLI